ncbi:MAG: hypothetical protein KAR42_06070 [candidate division Zixibacteria bacterium]|nr:hypothetical protein [candidate division Zixibacteria bacterium]
MAVSHHQLIANQNNAQKSTGPVTENGKTTSSKNAIKHGLYSDEIVIESPNYKENKDEYELLLSSLMQDFEPETLFQESLVRKIANCLWRSQRAIRAESAQIRLQLEDITPGFTMNKYINRDKGLTAEDVERVRNQSRGLKQLPNEESSLKILRYEMRLDKQLNRAYNLLLRLKKQTEKQKGEDSI